MAVNCLGEMHMVPCHMAASADASILAESNGLFTANCGMKADDIFAMQEDFICAIILSE